MERMLRVQTVRFEGPGLSSISPERRRREEKNRPEEHEVCRQEKTINRWRSERL